MPRRKKDPAAAEAAKAKTEKVLKARAQLGALAFDGSRKRPTKKNTRRSIGKAEAEKLMVRMDERVAEGDYDNMFADEWVALFCWMHDAIYGVSCVDETRADWKVAAYRAHHMLTEEFDGNAEEFLAYLRHAAKEEEGRETWRRSNRRSGKRVRWRDFFLLKTALNDYRLHKARTEGPV